jgi:hypothetical protein
MLNQILVRPGFVLAIVLPLCAGLVPVCFAEVDLKPGHVWGSFRPGAWKRVRVREETLDETGNVESTSTRETTTTLNAVTDAGVVLDVKVVVEVAGKRFDAKPQTIKQGYFGQIDDEKHAIEELDETTVDVSGRNYRCGQCRVTISKEGGDRVSRLCYSTHTHPQVLRRETKSTTPDGETTNYETSVEALAVDIPFKVLAEVKNAGMVRTLHVNSQTATLTFEVTCKEVPGGVVFHTSVERDKAGKILRRSTLELLDYGLGSPPANGG